jgi:SET domain-containing protein
MRAAAVLVLAAALVVVALSVVVASAVTRRDAFKPIAIPKLEIRPSRFGGRGVFAAAPIAAGEVLERCPYIVLEPDDANGRLRDYVFGYDDAGREMLVLGLGSMYNHADPPNAAYWLDGRDIVYTAERPLRRGEEVLISYGGEWWGSRDAQARA